LAAAARFLDPEESCETAAADFPVFRRESQVSPIANLLAFVRAFLLV
jgi:hypothetical protein